ncbi:hypothetical protein AAG906_015604 [Vitis piasezkii]
MVQTREPQLDQSIQRFHIQSSQRSHSRLKYQLTLQHLPLQWPLQSLYLRLHPLLSGHTTTLPIIPPISESSPSSEPRIAISISEYRGLCHTFQALATSQSILTQQMTALRAHQEQIIATQTQHTPS